MPSEREILAYLRRQPKQQAAFKQMLRELGAHGPERHELKDELARLVQEGTLVESRGQLFSLARGGDFLTGRLVRHRDGYGFVIPDERPAGLAGDVYVDPYGLHDAMHGDRVLVRVGKVDERGRAQGKIQKVLERSHATIVGQFHTARSGHAHPARGTRFCFAYVVPSDGRLREEIVIPPSQPLPDGLKPEEIDGAIVDVEITRFPTVTARGEGRVREVLGRPGDFGIDVEIIIRKHHLPHRFPAEVLSEAEAVPQVLGSRELAGRRDFRSLPIVTIDGETARDFDDAVLVERLPHGNYLLHVHIADVAHYVRESRPLDREARLRGTSVYFPDRAVPMLPVELSNGICSLNPGVDRLVLSCLMEIDAHGGVVRYELAEGVIRSAARMTYTNLNLILEGDAGLRQHYAPLVQNFERMKELALILNEKRRRRGSIDFDLPEPEIEFDEFGQMRSITRSERNIAHRLIEEFMLAANETVAGHLDRLAIASLYRIHEKPDPRRVMEFEQIATSFGYSLGIGGLAVERIRMHSGRGAGRGERFGKERGPRAGRTVELPAEIPITPRHYQQLTDKIAGKPEERILSYLMLRSLKQARYSEENSGHFALAAPVYTHFTSPIRRYPDLIVHRVLKSVLAGWQAPEERPRKKPHEEAPEERPGPIPEPQLKLVAEESSEAERRAQDAERELIEWKKAEFMVARVGEEFDGLVVNVTSFGFFVELTELFVEGLVHVSTLVDDRYFFREPAMEWVGERTKRRFALGSRVRVVVDRVDPLEHKINFALAENNTQMGKELKRR